MNKKKITFSCPNCGISVVTPIVKCPGKTCDYRFKIFDKKKKAEDFLLTQPSKAIKYFNRLSEGLWIVAFCEKVEPFVTETLFDLIDPKALQTIQTGLSERMRVPVTIMVRFNERPKKRRGREFPIILMEKNGRIFGRLDPIEKKAYYCKRCKKIRDFPQGEMACVSYNMDIAQKMIGAGNTRGKWKPCWAGLIDYTIPITINNFVAAVLFTGQIRWMDSKGEQKLAEGSKKASQIVPLTNEDLLSLANDQSQKKANDLQLNKLLAKYENMVGQISGVAENRYWAERRAKESEFITEVFASFAAISIIHEQDSIDKVLRLVCRRLCEFSFFHYGVFMLENETSAGSFLIRAKNGFQTDKASVFLLSQEECKEVFKKALFVVKESGEVKHRQLYDKVLNLLGVEEVNCALLFPGGPKRSLFLIVGRKEPLSDFKSMGRVSEKTKGFFERVAHGINIECQTALAQEESSKLLREKTQSFQFTTHEIAVPLQTIIAATEILKERIPLHKIFPVEKQKYYEQLFENIIHAVRTVSFLKEGFRFLLEDKVTLDITDTDILAEVIAPMVRMLRSTMRHQVGNVRIHYDRLNFTKIPILYVDKIALMEIVYNLLGNALKYSYENSTIRLDVLPVKDGWSICFSNYGIPIPAGLEKWIFEIGTRTKGAKMKSFTGTGKGLAIARRIAVLHGGDVTLVRNADPIVFAVSLPRKLIRRNWYEEKNSFDR